MPITDYLRVSAVSLATVAAALALALAVGMEPARAAFPGSNGDIVFDDASEVRLINSDGDFKDVDLTETLPPFNTLPDWSAEGNKIAFVHHSDLAYTNAEVYWMNSDGSEEKNLTNNTAARDVEPAFFPDGENIAFTSDGDGTFDIYKMTVDDDGNITDGPIKMTDSTASDTARDQQPVVSPDGENIAFISDRDGDFDIYKMKANAPESASNKAKKLTKRASLDAYPEWSPDGKKIAFSSDRSGNDEIFTMKPRPEGRENRPRNLTKNSARDLMPAFSPDGENIAFVSTRDPDGSTQFDMYKMKADGSGVVKLTNTVNVFNPSWQPVP